MSISHTPGPWWIRRAYHGAAGEIMAKRPIEPGLPQYQVNARHRGEGSSYCVATINYWEAQEANARLIAAAPELLKACSDWIDWLKPDSPWREDAADHEARMLDAMRAAISKATSRQPEGER